VTTIFQSGNRRVFKHENGEYLTQGEGHILCVEMAKEIERLRELLNESTEIISSFDESQDVGADAYVFIKVVQDVNRANKEPTNKDVK
jgi:hypothetical protein